MSDINHFKQTIVINFYCMDLAVREWKTTKVKLDKLLPKSSTPSGLSSCSLLATSTGIQRPISSESTSQWVSKALTSIPKKVEKKY